jgi:enoyl-CoA hydratase/carnithine racemase
MNDVLLVERREHAEIWTMNRPQAMNSLSKALLAALNEQLARLEELPSEELPRCVILTGAGEKAFCAGADLKERKTIPPDEVPAFVDGIRATMDRIARSVVPFVAAVNGYAFGGGTEAALACDLRVVGPSASMGLTETRLGIIPGAGGTQRLPRLVGPGRAKSMILTGRRVDADEALRIGLAEFHAGEDDVLERAMEVAGMIESSGPVAVRAAKASIDGGLDLPMDEALKLEGACYRRTLDTEDRLEALAAFAEKRRPDFKGR